MPTFETPQPISVVLDLSVANVQISASDRADTIVDVRPANPAQTGDVEAAQKTTVDFADGRVRISSPKSGWRQWVPWSGRGAISVRVEVPTGSHVRGTAGVSKLECAGRIGECNYKLGTGSVRLDDGGSVVLSAGKGDLNVEHATGSVDLKTTGAVHVGTVDGTVAVKNAHGDTSIDTVTGDARVNAAFGDVVVGHAGAAVEAKSAHGDIRLGSVTRGTIVAETAKGDVSVGIRPGVAAYLDLNTAYGTVHNDLDASAPPSGGDDAVDVRVRTAYGDVTIRRATTTESV